MTAMPPPSSSPTASPPFRCLVCHGPTGQPFLASCRDRYLRTPFEVDYWRCQECHLVQQYPVPADVAPFYEVYPVHQSKSRLYSRARRRLMAGVYQPPRQFPNNSRILDFGCGDGWYLEWCREAGHQAIGFEASHELSSQLQDRLDLPIYCSLDALISDHEASIDHITLHFVVEHLTDIAAVLGPLRQLLRPGGTLRYVVPNIDSWEYRWFRRRWHSLDPPRHISFPGESQARRLANDLDFDYLDETPVPFANGFGGSLPTLFLGRFHALAFFATLPLSLVVARWFPSGNQAYRLRRPADA